MLLMAKGYRILARGYRGPSAEIDIVARKRSTIVFIEVKARGSAEAVDVALGAAQRRRITSAAEHFLARHSECAGLDIRYDLILLSPAAWPRHIRAAFDAS